MENKIKTPTPLAEKGRSVVGYLQANEGNFFGHEIAEALELNSRGIHAVMNGLVIRGLVSKDKADAQVLDKDGNEVTRNLTVYFLTDAGKAFDVADLTK